MSDVDGSSTSPSVASRVWANDVILGTICSVSDRRVLCKIIRTCRYGFDVAVREQYRAIKHEHLQSTINKCVSPDRYDHYTSSVSCLRHPHPASLPAMGLLPLTRQHPSLARVTLSMYHLQVRCDLIVDLRREGARTSVTGCDITVVVFNMCPGPADMVAIDAAIRVLLLSSWRTRFKLVYDDECTMHPKLFPNDDWEYQELAYHQPVTIKDNEKLWKLLLRIPDDVTLSFDDEMDANAICATLAEIPKTLGVLVISRAGTEASLQLLDMLASPIPTFDINDVSLHLNFAKDYDPGYFVASAPPLATRMPRRIRRLQVLIRVTFPYDVNLRLNASLARLWTALLAPKLLAIGGRFCQYEVSFNGSLHTSNYIRQLVEAMVEQEKGTMGPGWRKLAVSERKKIR